LKLKASKTRLYNLVRAHHLVLPPMRKVDFAKAPRSRSWWLSWYEAGNKHKAYFSAVLGLAKLVMLPEEQVISINLDELRKYDLVEGSADE
jgi:hypothetical protein